MRRRRWLASPDSESAVYHCVSRVVDRRFVFGSSERDLFRSLMRELAEFCQVRILTYCIMSNHFHLLVEVPKRPDPLPDAEATLAALARLSGRQDVPALRAQLEQIRRSGTPEDEAAWLHRFHQRRWCLSSYLKLLKQRFSTAYNRSAGRKGTLWEERFKSLIVEGTGHALAATAAYIDLNPVRANMVASPENYRWCGFAEATAGDQAALASIGRILGKTDLTNEKDMTSILGEYARFLGKNVFRGPAAHQLTPPGAPNPTDRDVVLKHLADNRQVPLTEYLRCRIRYFCDGGALGSREFVERVFETQRWRFGPRRQTGARRMRGLAGELMFTLRALRIDLFS